MLAIVAYSGPMCHDEAIDCSLLKKENRPKLVPLYRHIMFFTKLQQASELNKGNEKECRGSRNIGIQREKRKVRAYKTKKAATKKIVTA